MNPDITHFDMDPPLGAAILLEVSTVLARREELGLTDQKEHAPLPRGALSCGEAVRCLSVLMILLHTKFPELRDPELMVSLLRECGTSIDGLTLN